jgi:plasmid stabilization system protein ParE
MSRALRFTRPAQADLDGIFSYIAQHNPTAAGRYIRELLERCHFYADSPFIGQEEPEIADRLHASPESVRSFLYRNHRCYYVVTDDEVRILGCIDTRRDLDTALEERFPS